MGFWRNRSWTADIGRNLVLPALFVLTTLLGIALCALLEILGGIGLDLSMIVGGVLMVALVAAMAILSRTPAE